MHPIDVQRSMEASSSHTFVWFPPLVMFVCQLGSTAIEDWQSSDRYPDFVTEGTGDQKVIMEAICTIKKATFDGVDCVGGDAEATGSVREGFGPLAIKKSVRDCKKVFVFSAVLDMV